LSCRPCRPLLSEVQSLYLRASQPKILHLSGANDLQTGFAMAQDILPWHSMSYVSLVVYLPDADPRHANWSGLPSSLGTPSIASQRRVHCIQPSMDRSPTISDSQASSCKASLTFLEFLLLVGTKDVTSGAMSPALLPSIHLSVQNKVLSPSPTLKIAKLWNTSLASVLLSAGSPCHGLKGSVRRSQHHLTLRASPCSLKSFTPRPPI
jgi:hypothetical protein